MTTTRCKHNLAICSQCVVVTDAAKRVADALNLAIIFHGFQECARSWMAFALADGTTDNVLYSSKQAAMEHVSNEFRYAYFKVSGAMGGANAKDCQLWMDYQRHAYDSGHRLTVPDSDLIMPLSRGGNPWLRR